MFHTTGLPRFVRSTDARVGAGVQNVPTWSGHRRSGADPSPDHPSLAEHPILIDLMTRSLRNIGLALALVFAGLGGTALAWTAGGTAAAQSGGETPLPPGWELCVLAGLSAPATPANVADLDEWQAAEGGSTNNTAAFNPFNTGRTTDTTGAAIPGVISANGFPAYANWPAGCLATVATLLQQNMMVVTLALRSGTVAPPTAFLAVVDQSAWCAPTADGLPCYASTILGAAASLPASLPVSPALDVYGNVTTDLQTYQQAVSTVTADQGVVMTRDQALAAAETQVAAARSTFGTASKALKGFAVSEYVSSGLYSSAPLVSSGSAQPLTRNTPQSQAGVVAQQYLGVTASNLITRDSAALHTVKSAVQQRDEAAKAVTQAALKLTADEAAENRLLDLLVKDVGTLEHAGVCTTVTITLPTPSASAPTGSASAPATPDTTTTTTTSPAPTTTSTTTPSTTVPTTTVPSTDPSTTTTTPPSTTTTTVPATVPTTVPATVPSTTTTTTVPTTPGPPAPSAMAPQVVAPGVTALQTCIAPLAPPPAI
jgi:hypothetical protein